MEARGINKCKGAVFVVMKAELVDFKMDLEDKIDYQSLDKTVLHESNHGNTSSDISVHVEQFFGQFHDQTVGGFINGPDSGRSRYLDLVWTANCNKKKSGLSVQIF